MPTGLYFVFKCFPSLYPLTSLGETLFYKDTIYYFPAMTF
jgi:hypothetical protein